MLSGPNVILGLKVAVSFTTVLLVASLVALACRRRRLHGLLNTLVTILIFLAVCVFEVILRVVGVNVTAHMDASAKAALNVHLCFAIPILPALGVMLATGRKRHKRTHLAFSLVFFVLWTGMLVTGLFFLPHTAY